MYKLDIASGQRKNEGFTGIDITPGVDIVHDLEVFPWPIESESVDEAICNHYIEHTNDLIGFMEEVYRILKPEAKITIVAPYYSSVRAWQDPTHKRAISEWSFLYYNKKWREENKLDHYGIKCDFDYCYGFVFNTPWNMKSEEARAFAQLHYINVIADIQVTMIKRKLDG
jgi:SAM-dependent methyltransferase